MLRVLAIALLGLALLPAGALAVDINRDTDTGVITIVDDAGTTDDILVARSGGIDAISRVGGGLVSDSDDCTDDAGAVTVPAGARASRSTSAAATTASARTRSRPRSASRAGPGTTTSRPAAATTCSPAAPGNDTLDGQRRASTTTSARPATTRSRRATGTPSGSRAERHRRGATTTSPTSSPSASAGSTATATASAPPSTATTRARTSRPGAPEVFDNGVDENCDGRDNPNLDLDGDGFAQPGGLQRRQRGDPPERARDPRQHRRRELRPPRGPVRRARRRGLQPVGRRAHVRAPAHARRAQRAARAPASR